MGVGDWTSNWNVFTVDWTPTWIAMYVNGEVYASYYGADYEKAAAAFTDPLFLALTACVMDRTPPTPSDVFPMEYWIDWGRVYAFE